MNYMNTGGIDRAVVLLIEDDPGDQELTRRALAEGVFMSDLRIVGDGEEAMAYLTRRGKYEDPTSSPKPDLILSDLNMPKMDGKQVLERLRADPGLAKIPVVVLTTSSNDSEIERMYELGCNSFITKPVGMEEFVNAVHQLGTYWFKLVALPKKAV